VSGTPAREPPRQTFTLVVGARHACLYCRDRVTHGGRCARCGRPRLELAGHQANGKLVLLARRVREANARGGDGGDARSEVIANIAHAVALAGALVSLGYSLQVGGLSGTTRAMFVLLAVALGYLVGYLGVGLALVVFMLLAALCSLSLAAALLVGAAGVALLTLLVPGTGGARARSALSDWTERAIGRLFEPVFRLRGAQWRPLAGAREPDVGRQPARLHEGLRPTPPALALPERTTDAEDAFEGTLVSGDEVSVGSLRATIVGAAGYTVGSRIEDATVAPFVLETAACRVHVEVEVGTVIVPRSLGRTECVEDLPLAWGVARSRRNPEKLPPHEPTSLFVIRPGARLRIEGGERAERSTTGDLQGYRGVSFERTVRGTREAPVRITVL
jgi:hypothetical protein